MMEAKMNAGFAHALEEVDWQSYQDNVIATFKEALAKYRIMYAAGDIHLISQIALSTDPYYYITAVDFETSVHAQKEMEATINFMRENELEVEFPDDFRGNGNPADFEYERFHTFQHQELAALSEFNRIDPELDAALLLQLELDEALLLKIEANLLVVVERVQQLQLLREEPTEDEVWIGVNSPLDWYDDVVKMTVRIR